MKLTLQLTLTIAFFLVFIGRPFGQIGFGPVLENRTLQIEAAHHFPKGWNAAQQLTLRENENCEPLSLTAFYLKSGDSITFELDTFNIGGGDFTLLNCDVNPVGELVANDTTVQVTYFSEEGVTFGIDTICAEVCTNENASCDTIQYEIYVTRSGTRFVEPLITVSEGEFVSETCLDLLPTLGNPLCINILPINEGYDGEEDVITYFTRYDQPDSCFRYRAARIPGVDTVYIEVCDDVAVCDTFLIPFEVVVPNFGPLPFFDDFSYAGPYPQQSHWLDDKSFVSPGMAPNAPSIGTLTLDGIDGGGSPYPRAFGRGDRLTSRPVDLSNLGVADYLNLKFFYTPKGYGLYPNEDDSLIVEFYTVNNEWETVFSASGIDTPLVISEVAPFLFENIRLNKVEYFHENFQFRFVNFVSPAGIYDNWHLDYVELSEGRGSDQQFPDLAFTRPATPMLKTYRHAPWKHVQGDIGNLLSENYRSALYNHFQQTITIGQSAIHLEEARTGTNFAPFTLTENALDNNIPPQESVTRERTIPPGIFDDYINTLNGLPADAELEFTVEYDLAQTSQTARFLVNDTVRTVTECKDYFAYDDGSAEWFVFLRYPQISPVEPTAAIKFHTLEEDVLSAVQFHFPHANGDVSSQFFLLNVWIGELGEEPDYQSANLLRPLYVDGVFDSLQAFTNYRLTNSFGEDTTLIIPENTDFYVGWTQVTVLEDAIPVGYDLGTAYDSINSEVNFVNVEGDWLSFAETGEIEVPGAVMIRPIMSENPPPTTTSTDQELIVRDDYVVFPNPSDGRFHLAGLPENLQDVAVELYNPQGQRLGQWTGETTFDLGHLPKGVYFLKIRNFAQAKAETHRLILND